MVLGDQGRMIWRAYIDLDSVSLSEESAFDDLVEFLKNDPVGSQLLPLTRGPKCGAEVSSLKILKSNFIKTKQSKVIYLSSS